ncbi:MAG: DegV family protein [Eubacterium sp.]|nr:DegV family protein [Eubacterium sp.]
MKEILITTESGSDLPENLIRKYDFHVIPMHVIMDGQSYDDGTIPVERVYEYYESTKKVPTTSCVNVHEYIEFFTQMRSEHPDSVIYHFSYSSNASATYQNAHTAIEQGEFEDIYLIDTKSVSGGCTAHMVAAKKLIDAKKDTITDYAALAAEIQDIADRVECHFIPGTLEYLRAGGRVSNAAYIAANILHLKPLIEIDGPGYLQATKKYRGSIPKIAGKFIDEFFTRYDLDRENIYLMYSSGLDQKTLDYMKDRAVEAGFKEYDYVMTGCVISCHGGKGAIGLAGIRRE